MECALIASLLSLRKGRRHVRYAFAGILSIVVVTDDGEKKEIKNAWTRARPSMSFFFFPLSDYVNTRMQTQARHDVAIKSRNSIEKGMSKLRCGATQDCNVPYSPHGRVVSARARRSIGWLVPATLRADAPINVVFGTRTFLGITPCSTSLYLSSTPRIV